ncbi:DUF4214 domain-containing protein [Sulfurimonas sp. NW9]|uniref:DUF4214 domain-containing protein n=1 Tax=Sulfurimonas sp. NW9 TaxID=2922728 RepID=UPI003DA8CF75
MLNRTQVEDEISGLYLTTIGRAADSAGVAYWTDQVMNGNMSVAEVGQSFFDQPEVQAKYDGLDTTAFVSAVYENVLGRPADTAGLDYWVEQLDGGAFSQDRFIEAVNNGATGDDALRLENMKIVGYDYMKKVGDDIDLASSVLDGISADPQSKAEALALIDYYNANKDSIATTDADSIAQWKDDAAFSTFENHYAEIGPDVIDLNFLHQDADVIAATQIMYAEYDTPETVEDIEEVTTITDEVLPGEPVAAAFEFTTDWLNGKTLYNEDAYADGSPGSFNIIAEEYILAFTDSSLSLTDGSFQADYTIDDGGIIEFYDANENMTNYVKATHVFTDANGNMEALALAWNDTLERTLSQSYEATGWHDYSYFVLDQANVEEYAGMAYSALEEATAAVAEAELNGVVSDTQEIDATATL